MNFKELMILKGEGMGLAIEQIGMVYMKQQVHKITFWEVWFTVASE